MVLDTPLDWSFIWIQFFVLNLDSWFGVLSSKFIIFWHSALYYYANLNSSMIFCIFSGDLFVFFHHLFGISISFLASSSSKLFLRLLLFHQVFYCQLNHSFYSFLNCSIWSSFCCICCRFFSTIKKFLIILIAHVFSNFSCMCTKIFSK